MVAIDGGHTGHRALQMGVQLARLSGACLSAVYVTDTITGIAPFFAWGSHRAESENLSHGRHRLEHLTETVSSEVPIERIFRAGEPAQEIVAAAKDWGPDLLIVGRPSHHRLGRLLLGSVDETVLDALGCAVLVISSEN
jgi:nucleotide-binding universal stress UspA family protein